MNMKHYLTRLLAVFAVAFVFNACVEDDDFDVPEIPPITETAEVVSEGGGSASFEGCVMEDFQSYDDGMSDFPQYENVSTYGTRLWNVDEYQGAANITLSAFNAQGLVYAYFLIPVNFDEADSFSFNTQDRYWNGDPLKVLIVTDYEISGNIAEATTEDITDAFTISTGNETAYSPDKVNSGSYDLGSYSGNGFIAFKYVGDGGGITTTIHIDDIMVVDNDDADCEAGGGNTGGQTSKGGSEATAVACLTENFDSFAEDLDEFPMYENVTVAGERFWRVTEFGGNQYIQATAYNASSAMDSWFLVNVDFDNADSFSFGSKDGYYNGEALTVLYSTSHTVGAEINPDDWTDITSEFEIATGSTSGYPTDFLASGDYDLSSISGSGFIAFRYQGDPNDVTTTYQIDNISVVDNDDTNCEGNDGGTDEFCFMEDFASFENNSTDFATYQNITTTGDKKWESREYSGNKYAQMSAFESTGDQVAWFLMGVNFDNATTLSFKTKDGYNNGDPLTVWYSTDYDEQGDPTTANWTEITSEFAISTGNSGGYADDFTESGEYTFSGLSGNGHIAFRYEGSGSGVTTTIQLDDISLGGSGSCKNDLPAINDGGDGGTDDATMRINEFHYDNAGGDENEFVEIRNTGGQADQPSDLSAYTVYLVNGNNGEVYNSATFDALTQTCTDDYCYYVWEPSSIQNGSPDGIAISGPEGLIEFISYDGTFTGVGAPVDGVESTDIGVVEESDGELGGSIQLNDAGDTWVVTTAHTKGEANNTGGGDGGTTDSVLFISEYVEGSSNNKYIELYNGTDSAIDLSEYMLKGSNNGGDWKAERDLQLTGTLEAGSFYIIATDQSEASILEVADLALPYESPVHFNGDDAIGLFKNGELVDVVGIPTEDPGSGWEVAGVADATQNHTLIRKSSITAGNTDWAASAGTNEDDSEWIVKDQDDFSNIGQR